VDFLQWWNLVFLLPAVAALLYLLLLTLGAVPSEGHDLDVHLDHGADFHADAGDGHADIHPGSVHADSDPFHGALNLIGVGRIPLSLLLMSFFFLWGFFGWVGNRVFSTVIAAPGIFIWPSLALALVGSVALTRLLAVRLGRLMPNTESYGSSARELVGRIADVRYPLTETTGSVQLYDGFGTLHEVPARVLPGELAIPIGERVILWRYDERAGSYLAIQDDAIEESEAVSRNSEARVGKSVNR